MPRTMHPSERAGSESQAKPDWISAARARSVALVASTAIAFYVCYRIALPFVPALAWALALAVIAQPLHRRVCERVRRPTLAAAIAVAVVGVTIVAPAFFVAQVLAREATSVSETLKAEGESGHWREVVTSTPTGARVLEWVEGKFDLRGEMQRIGQELIPRLASLVAGSVWLLTQLAVTLFALFFFFRDQRAILRTARSFVPLTKRETEDLFRRIGDTLHATVFGTLAVSAVQGLLGGLMFWWLGLPAPVLWGAVMGLLSIIPVLGAFIVWGPAALYLAATGDWSKALILTGWGTLVVGTVDNLIYPMLVGQRIHLHTLPVFLAIIGGIALFGGSGLVLGPFTLAVTVSLAEIWRRRGERERKAAREAPPEEAPPEAPAQAA